MTYASRSPHGSGQRVAGRQHVAQLGLALQLLALDRRAAVAGDDVGVREAGVVVRVLAIQIVGDHLEAEVVARRDRADEVHALGLRAIEQLAADRRAGPVRRLIQQAGEVAVVGADVGIEQVVLELEAALRSCGSICMGGGVAGGGAADAVVEVQRNARRGSRAHTRDMKSVKL